MLLKRTQTAALKVLHKLLRLLGGCSACVSPTNICFFKVLVLVPSWTTGLWLFQYHAHEEAGIPRLPATPLSWSLTRKDACFPILPFPSALCQQQPAPSSVLDGAT